MSLTQNLDTFSENLNEIKEACVDNAQDILTSTPHEFKGERKEWIKRLHPIIGGTIKDIHLRVRKLIVEEKTKHYLRTIKRIIQIQSPKNTHPGHISDADIEKAKDFPIEDLYDGKLRRDRKLLVGKCELHAEKTGSFVIYLNQNSYYCFGCSSGGSVIDYAMKKYNLEFLPAVKRLI